MIVRCYHCGGVAIPSPDALAGDFLGCSECLTVGVWDGGGETRMLTGAERVELLANYPVGSPN